MRPLLNRHVPFDAIVRWWYLVVIGPAVGLMLSLVTNFKPIVSRPKSITFVEGPPSNIELAITTLYQSQGWKDDLLLTVLGLGIACGVIWLLEEIRFYKQQIRDP